MDSERKTCRGPCGLERPMEEFHKNPKGKNGKHPWCKTCRAEAARAYRAANPENDRAYRESNSEKIKAYKRAHYERNKERFSADNRAYRDRNKDKLNAKARAYHESHKEECRANKRAYYQLHKEEFKAKCRAWADRNKEKMSAYRRAYRERNRDKRNANEKARRASDPGYKLHQNISSKIKLLLKGQRKSSSTMEYVGCSRDALMSWLQSKFIGSMAWNNHGRVWHIDHKVPCSAFRIVNPDGSINEAELRRCWNYRNLQPMWAKRNLRLGAKRGQAHQPELGI